MSAQNAKAHISRAAVLCTKYTAAFLRHDPQTTGLFTLSPGCERLPGETNCYHHNIMESALLYTSKLYIVLTIIISHSLPYWIVTMCLPDKYNKIIILYFIEVEPEAWRSMSK